MNFSLYKFYNKFIRTGKGQEGVRKTKLFSFSLITGILVSFIVLAIISKDNPVTTLFNGFKRTFNQTSEKNSAFTGIAILGLSGIAVGVGFKTGLFNMGVSGQMIAGGFTSGIIAIMLGNSVPNGLGQILVLLISITFGAIFAMIAGALKAYFRIHEVVSTILLNWIAVYIMIWILGYNESMKDVIMESKQMYLRSKVISDNFLLRINGNSLWPSIIILVLTGLLMWFVIFKTTFGRSLVMVGKNPDAAQYAGVNTKLLSIYSMGISGAIAGVLGAVVYFGLNSQFAKLTIDSGVPLEGFNGIAIALIAFSHPIMIIPVSIFFGLIQQSFALAGNPVYINLIIGIIMLFSALNIIFDYIKPTKLYYRVLYGKEGAFAYVNYLEQKGIKIENFVDKKIIKAEQVKELEQHLLNVKSERTKLREQIVVIKRANAIKTLEKLEAAVIVLTDKQKAISTYLGNQIATSNLEKFKKLFTKNWAVLKFKFLGLRMWILQKHISLCKKGGK